MDSYIQLLLFVLIGLLLLWFGFTLFVRLSGNGGPDAGGGGNAGKGRRQRYKKTTEAPREGVAGSPRTCPVCSLVLEHGERVKSSAFPPVEGQGRLMHIEGCGYCLGGSRSGKRKCPVCGAHLETNEILIARMFDKPGRSHVHVLGCSRCRGFGANRK
jgi:hypothetical protein